jgi:hypothetical protein
MLRQVAIVTALGSAALLGACGGSSTAATPVPVSGSTKDMAALAGEWSGEYLSLESGRSGSIVFNLKAGTDSATGDVIMSAMTGGPRGGDQTSPQPDAAPTPPQVLAIRFVSIEGGRVQGKLDPYIEPTCKCQLTTVFDGRLYGKELSGTYTTMLPDGRVQSGRWSVTRQ